MSLPPDNEEKAKVLLREDGRPADLVERLKATFNSRTNTLLAHETDSENVEYLPLDISKSVAVPKPFTRLGLFTVPSGGSIKKIDYSKEIMRKWTLAYDISTQFHKATVWGPPLDTYDEEVWCAAMELTWHKRITAQRQRLPAKRPRLSIVDQGVAPIETNLSEIATVVVGEVTAYQINNFLGKSSSTEALERTRFAILKLALTSVMFEDEKLGHYGVFHLLSFIGSKDASGALLIQWDPVIVSMRDNPQMRVYIDLNVRRELTDTGKMIHRFLSSQLSNKKPNYEIGLDRLQIAIRLNKEPKYFKRDLEKNMKRCVNIGWIKKADVTGSGRKTSFKLTVHKS